MAKARMRCRRVGPFVLALIALAVPASADTIVWLPDSAWGVSFTDVEKSPTNPHDDLFCWAAAASNMLSYTGWGNPLDADSVFSQFLTHWTDGGGKAAFGLDWWFTGADAPPDDPGWAHPDGGGDHWPNVQLFPNVLQSIGWHQGEDRSSAAARIESFVDHGWSVGIDIYFQCSHSYTCGGHALTVWGYEKASDGTLTALYVSDSDSDKTESSPPDTVQRYEVRYDEQDRAWYVKGIAGWGDDSVWIGAVTGLAPLPIDTLADDLRRAVLLDYGLLDSVLPGSDSTLRDRLLRQLASPTFTPLDWSNDHSLPTGPAPVPEPATLALVASGIAWAGLAFRRRGR